MVEAQSWLEYSETVHETVQANNMLIVALEELFILLEDPDIAISKRLKNYLEELEENEYLLSQYCSIYNEAAYMYNSNPNISQQHGGKLLWFGKMLNTLNQNSMMIRI